MTLWSWCRISMQQTLWFRICCILWCDNHITRLASILFWKDICNIVRIGPAVSSHTTMHHSCVAQAVWSVFKVRHFRPSIIMCTRRVDGCDLFCSQPMVTFCSLICLHLSELLWYELLRFVSWFVTKCLNSQLVQCTICFLSDLFDARRFVCLGQVCFEHVQSLRTLTA